MSNAEKYFKKSDLILPNSIVSENPFPKLHPDCVPIAVEFRPNSELLFDFKHPENATYIFGPEDGTLDRSILTRCHSFVKMDTMECLNLATAVSIVLYDRSLKEHHGLVKPV